MTPAVPEEERRRRASVIEDCLREGFSPIGMPSAKGGAIYEAARRLGVNDSTLRGAISRRQLDVDWSLYQPEKPRIRVKAGSSGIAPSAPEQPIDGRQRTAYEDTIRALRAELRDRHRAELDADAVRAEIFGLATQQPDVPDWMVRSDPGGSAPGVPITIWSDFHWGEVVRAEEVSGVNEFNTEIARKRFRLLVERTVDLCFHHMVRPEYPGIVVCLGGDMITGEIHQELAETNDATTMQVLLDLQSELIRGLEIMAERFGRVFVPCVVGNHGRGTLKPRAKGRVVTSFEWLLYCQLERHFRGDDRITFLVPGEADAHFRVYGHRYMLTHGDSLGVKGGDGIIGALGPITRGRIKVSRSEAQIGRDFDTLLIGHWHQYMPMRKVITNGSLKGFDEYARLMLRVEYEPPQQALWFQHPRWGITYQMPVVLDEPRKAPEGEWVAWRQVTAA